MFVISSHHHPPPPHAPSHHHLPSYLPIIIPHLLTFPSSPPTSSLFPPPHSHSDGEPISEPPLVPVAAAPVEAQSVDSALLSKLYQLVARQQVELQQLQEEQQRSFALLQQQLEEMRVSTVEQHRASREQRILHQDIKTVAQWEKGSFSPTEMKDTLLIITNAYFVVSRSEKEVNLVLY